MHSNCLIIYADPINAVEKNYKNKTHTHKRTYQNILTSDAGVNNNASQTSPKFNWKKNAKRKVERNRRKKRPIEWKSERRDQTARRGQKKIDTLVHNFNNKLRAYSEKTCLFAGFSFIVVGKYSFSNNRISPHDHRLLFFLRSRVFMRFFFSGSRSVCYRRPCVEKTINLDTREFPS